MARPSRLRLPAPTYVDSPDPPPDTRDELPLGESLPRRTALEPPLEDELPEELPDDVLDPLPELPDPRDDPPELDGGAERTG